MREAGPVCDVCVKLYANSQSSFLKSLKAGQLIVLTNVVLKSVCTDSCHRSFKLQSSNKSGIYKAREFGDRHKISEVCVWTAIGRAEGIGFAASIRMRRYVAIIATQEMFVFS